MKMHELSRTGVPRSGKPPILQAARERHRVVRVSTFSKNSPNSRSRSLPTRKFRDNLYWLLTHNS
jgi:hypothetical protein